MATGPPPPLYLYRDYDFGVDVIKYGQLHQEIIDDVGISKNLIGIKSEADRGRVWIRFGEKLENAEKTVLDGIIRNHVTDVSPISYVSETINPRDNKIDNTTYTRLCILRYLGSSKRKLLKIKVVGYMNSSTTDYSIRVYDTIHDQEIVSKTMTNTEEDTFDLGDLSNIPVDETKLEVSAKITGSGKEAYLESITFMYDF
jgi:hypothetical protein